MTTQLVGCPPPPRVGGRGPPGPPVPKRPSTEAPTVAVRATSQSVAYGASDAASVLVGINLTAKAAPEADS